MIEAKIILDSVTEEGHRLTTFETTFHRFILAEVNTHRVFSRNSASSRAIPVTKQIDRVVTDPAMPIKFASEQRGMQGGDEVEELAEAKAMWLKARDSAVSQARGLVQAGVHKSVTNRLLEPFMWHTAIISGTSWENFFALRANPLAQPEFQVLAGMMEGLYRTSEPQELGLGEWHLPYLQEDDPHMNLTEQIKISVARCARVSYLTHDGKRDIDKDLDLYNRLTNADPMHSSPLEHVATPWGWNAWHPDLRRKLGARPRIGNFVGWRQHRLDLESRKMYNSYS
jgi:thymidylate synthase ThyX